MIPLDGIARAFARRLERGASMPGLGTVASLWGAVAPIARPLVFPRGVRIITVGGTTLGGSGKTPLAIACARALRADGVDVAFVGHAHRARTTTARIVAPGDVTAGDEAHEAATALAADGVPVVVGPTRQLAVDRAAREARVLVIDGPLALRPQRAHLSLLAVDGEAPFGSGVCVPHGDLRARADRLVACANVVVSVGEIANPTVARHHAAMTNLRVRAPGKDDIPLGELHRSPVRVATAMARPQRFLATLARHGIRVAEHLERADHTHAPLPPGPWIVPRKNAVWASRTAGVSWVEYDIDLPSGLRERLCTRPMISFDFMRDGWGGAD